MPAPQGYGIDPVARQLEQFQQGDQRSLLQLLNQMRTFDTEWFRVAFNTEFFGLKESNTGIRNAQAIQAAHDAMPASGGIIYTNPGNYPVASGIVFTKPVKFIGGGLQLTKFSKSDATGDLFTMNGQYQSIGQMTIQAPGVPQTAGSFVQYGASAVRQEMEQIAFFDFWKGILWNGGATLRQRDCLFLGGVPTNGIAVHIASGAAADLLFLDSYIDTGVGSEIANGFRIDVSGSTVIENYLIAHADSGIQMVPAGTAVNSLTILNTVCSNNITRGINVVPGIGGSVSRLRIRGGECSGTTSASGIGCFIVGSSGAVNGVQVDGLSCFGNITDGMQIIQPATEVHIRGGFFSGNGRDGIRFGTVGGSPTNFSAIGARCGPWGGYGANTGFGINVTTAAATNYIIAHNHLQGNTAGGIQDLGVVPKIVGPNL